MKSEETTFTITSTMRSRWVPHFLGILRRMQVLGEMGSSRKVTLYADGDGDFRPKFKWDGSMPCPAAPLEDDRGNQFFDSG